MMTRIVFNQDIIHTISLFESVTGAKVKDCLSGETITFIIEAGQMGLAIGKQGKSLKRVEQLLKKPVKLVEFSPEIEQFIRHAVKPLTRFEVAVDGKKVIIKGEDTKTKGLLIGRDRANLNKLLSLLKRYFDVEDIKVI